MGFGFPEKIEEGASHRGPFGKNPKLKSADFTPFTVREIDSDDVPRLLNCVYFRNTFVYVFVRFFFFVFGK